MSKPHKAAVPYFELLPMVIAPEWNRCWPTSAKRKEKEIWSYLFARVPSPFPLLTILVASRFVTPRLSRPNGTLSSIKWWQWNYHAVISIRAYNDYRSYCIAMIRPSSPNIWKIAFGLIEKFCWQTSNRVVYRSVIDQLYTWAEHLKNRILTILLPKYWIFLLESTVNFSRITILFFYIFYMYNYILYIRWLKCIFLIYK